MGNGEWGVGSGERMQYLYSIPHSPLPIPGSPFDHSSHRFLTALADFSGDVRDQRSLLVQNPAGSEDAARNRRGDLVAISDQVSAAGAALLFGQKVEHDANGPQRILEEPLRGPVLQPVRQHFVRRAAGLDASGLRDSEDHPALAVRDSAFGPGHLDERDYVQQRNRLRRVAEVLQSFENFLVVDAHHFGHLLAVGLARPALAQLLDQFLILPSEILFFQPMFALGEFIFLSHNASTIRPVPSGSENNRLKVVSIEWRSVTPIHGYKFTDVVAKRKPASAPRVV